MSAHVKAGVLSRTIEAKVGCPWFDQLNEKQVVPVGSLEDVDPVTKPRRGLITKSTPVGSIGSCFSQEIKKWLTGHEYNYVQVEEGPTTCFGSARFGNVTNTGSLRQEFEGAMGLFEPAEKCWRDGGKLLDPYRKNILWEDEAAAQAERADHYANVRRLLGEIDVLLCTMGMAEVWRSTIDGAVFGMFPPPGVHDASRHESMVLSVAENVRNLERAYEIVRGVNEDVQLVVTLSPVSMHATMRDMSVFEADAVSKATLRVALDEFCGRHPEVIYFPSYEIVTKLSREAYRRDNRHVSKEVIDRIMTIFMRAYGEG